MPPAEPPRITSFDFAPGRKLLRKYEIVSRVGAGWEGEVYKVRELATGIERAAKFFFPHRNEGNRAIAFYARKLNKLRHCSIVVQYHTQELITFRRQPITFLVSEYVEGDLLSRFLARQPKKRLTPFEGLHLLEAMARGVACIHHGGEYHGDLHAGNVIVRREGLSFAVKLIDVFYQGRPSAARIQDDVCDLIRLFYDAIGGRKHYAAQPPEVKRICCGLKRSLILAKFRNAGQLARYLATMPWES